MRRLLAITCALCFFACNRPSDPQDNSYVLTGVFDAGSEVHQVRLQHIGLTTEAVTNAQVECWFEGSSIAMTPSAVEPGVYEISSDVLPLSEGDYAGIRADIGDITLRGETTLPNNLGTIGSNTLAFEADLGSTGVPTIHLDWENQIGVLFVLQLDTVGPDPHLPIPFANGGGNFELFFNLPLTSPNQTLWDTDFGYYGLHQLTVYAIPDAYEQLFLYPSENFTENLLASPDNIENGSGYLTSVSKTVINITVEEE